MSDKPFVPFYTSDFLAGTSGMTAATKGVYITLLCLMYEKEEPIGQSWDMLARRCGCTLPAFKKAVECLQDDGKIEVNDGKIWSEKCEKRIGKTRPHIPVRISDAVWARDGKCCSYCGDTDGPFHLDHIHPWSLGGGHTEENLTVACAKCNLSKGAKTLEEWQAETMQ